MITSPSSSFPQQYYSSIIESLDMEHLSLSSSSPVSSKSKNVYKFGGTSVGTPERLAQVLSIISSEKENITAVVVSAMGDTTDFLLQAVDLAANGQNDAAQVVIDDIEKIAIIDGNTTQLPHRSLSLQQLQTITNNHHQQEQDLFPREDITVMVKEFLDPLRQLLLGMSLLREKTPQALDTVLSFGERLTAKITTFLLNSSGIPAHYVDARDWVTTDASFGSARVFFEKSKQKLLQLQKNWNGAIPIVTGFIGQTECKRTTTLGRNGSDYTATMIGAIFKVDYVVINTDICGVMTADPTIVHRAVPVSHLSHYEALELAIYGNRMFHARTMIPLIEADVTMIIRNTMDPNGQGTYISKKNMSNSFVTCTTSLENLALFEIRTRILEEADSKELLPSQIGRRVSQCLEGANIHIWLSIRAAHGQAVAVVVPVAMKEKAEKSISNEFRNEISNCELDDISVTAPVTMVSIVGEKLKSTVNIASRFFVALGKAGINVLAIGQGTSTRSLSCIVDAKDTKMAVSRVHDAFNFSILDVSIILIGSTETSVFVLQQLLEQAKLLKEQYSIEIHIVGYGSIKVAFQFSMNGFKMEEVMEQTQSVLSSKTHGDFVLHSRPTSEQLDIFKDASVPIVIDCSGRPDVNEFYSSCFRRGIHVIASNARSVCGLSETQGNKYSPIYHSISTTLESAPSCCFLYNSAIGASLPILDTLANILRTGDRLIRIDGVLSGSLNFITNLAIKGIPFSQAVVEAMNKGYTEINPLDDLFGVDVSNKIRVLSRVLRLPIKKQDIVVEPMIPYQVIDNIKASCNTKEELEKALQAYDDEFHKKWVVEGEKSGKRVRYVASLSLQMDKELSLSSMKINASVKPMFVDDKNAFYGIQENDIAVSFTTTRYASRPLVLCGMGTGGPASASGVLNDVLKISQSHKGM